MPQDLPIKMSPDNVRRVQVQASLQKFLDGQIASRMSHKINSANLCAENEMKKITLSLQNPINYQNLQRKTKYKPD